MNLVKLPQQERAKTPIGSSLLVGGMSGIGKSTFCSKIDLEDGKKTIFACTEQNGLDIFGESIADWSEFEVFISQLKKPAVQELYSTVVIDSLDQLIALGKKHRVTAANNRLKSVAKKKEQKGDINAVKELVLYDGLEDIEWGKGTVKLRELVADITTALLQIQKAGYFLVCIAKGIKKGNNYEFLSTVISDELVFSFDNVGWAALNEEKERVLLFDDTSDKYFAKRRIEVPNEIPLSFKEFYSYYNKVESAPIEVKEPVKLSFKEVKKNLLDLRKKLLEEDEDNDERISETIAKILGSGVVVKDLSPTQENAKLLQNIILLLSD